MRYTKKIAQFTIKPLNHYRDTCLDGTKCDKYAWPKNLVINLRSFQGAEKMNSANASTAISKLNWSSCRNIQHL